MEHFKTLVINEKENLATDKIRKAYISKVKLCNKAVSIYATQDAKNEFIKYIQQHI